MVKVICVGLPRTGTTSLMTALEQLNLGPCHHMWACIQDVNQSKGFIKAMDAVLQDKEPDTEEMRRLLANFPSIADAPTADLWRYTTQMYPDAKVVCTRRDPAKWRHSVATTIWLAMTSRIYYFAVWWLPNMHHQAVLAHKLHDLWMKNYGSFDESMMGKRLAEIQASIPPERLLVFSVEEGWEPLCKFLDVPVPDQPFPRANDTAAITAFLKAEMAKGMMRWALVFAGLTATAAVVATKFI